MSLWHVGVSVSYIVNFCCCWRWHIWVILMYAEGCGVHSTYWVPCWCVVIPFSDLWRGSCAWESFTWNYFSHEELCTNNHLEGWHSRLKRVSRKAHPNLFEVVEILKRSRQQLRWQLNSWLEGEGLDLSEEKLCNMKIPSRDFKQNLPMELDH